MYLVSIFWRSVEVLQADLLYGICKLSDFFLASYTPDCMDLEIRHDEEALLRVAKKIFGRYELQCCSFILRT
jgi:hypothetical protein